MGLLAAACARAPDAATKGVPLPAAGSGPAATRSLAAATPTSAAGPDGEALARRFCTTCHLLPEAGDLPAILWPNLLDVMGTYLGHDPHGLVARQLAAPGSRLLDPTGVPAAPLLDAAAWARLRGFYIAGPAAGLPPANPPATPLQGFEVQLVETGVPAPIVSLARIEDRGLWLGEARTRTLRRLDARGRELGRIELPSPPIDLLRDGHALDVTLIGQLQPTDARDGALVRVDERLRGPASTTLRGLFRTTQSLAADLDGDGDVDRVTCEFGDSAGRLAWWEKTAAGHVPHVLIDRPGAVAAALLDADTDGRLDVLALMAQAREGIVLLRNEGNGAFSERPLIEQRPFFGYTDLRLTDLTGDGRPEVVAVNGDNGDLPAAPLRSHHGLRTYAFGADGALVPLAFLPLHGAFRAVPADLDGDGDVDLAAVSFFADPRTPEQGFAVFENGGSGTFERRTLPVGAAGHWMTLDAGDLDGDGDVDLVLGAAYPEIPVPPGQQPPDASLLTLPGVAILRNLSK